MWVVQKTTDTGTILIFTGCAPLQYKRNVIEGTVPRVFQKYLNMGKFGHALEKNRKQWIENQYPKNSSTGLCLKLLTRSLRERKI